MAEWCVRFFHCLYFHKWFLFPYAAKLPFSAFQISSYHRQTSPSGKNPPQSNPLYPYETARTVLSVCLCRTYSLWPLCSAAQPGLPVFPVPIKWPGPEWNRAASRYRPFFPALYKWESRRCLMILRHGKWFLPTLQIFLPFLKQWHVLYLKGNIKF